MGGVTILARNDKLSKRCCSSTRWRLKIDTESSNAIKKNLSKDKGDKSMNHFLFGNT